MIAQARNFVCARLATYESKTEGKFLESLARTRSGELENTVYAVLAPDGKTKLSSAGRSPHMIYRARDEKVSVRLMVEALRRVAKKYPGKKPVQALPYMADVRRGLNVASCDLLPLVVVTGPRKDFKKTLAALTWNAKWRGRFLLAHTTDDAELRPITKRKNDARFLVVAPDEFGVKGVVLAQTKATDAAALQRTLMEGLKQFAPDSKDSRRHIRQGRSQGVHWETEIPVTDPGGRGR